MEMMCNLTESVRMREELILKMAECDVLSKIYKY